jgi:diguanylate cyclase (GGDEF)-like protein
MVDIDHFKNVNDEWGHPVGDLALKHFVAVCRSIMRQHDVVGRVGGEEFALLLPETEHDAALGATERLRRSIQEQPVEAGPGLGTFHITISAGVVLHEAGEEPMQLWSRADSLMYEAKKAGRNCVKSLTG